jgi:uncharacterized protein (DUF2147 family)
MFARHSILLIFLLVPFAAAQKAGAAGILGDWREPTGSVIEIFNCGSDICAKMVAISQQAPSQFDTNNPDASSRKHPLCGLQIGYGFHLIDPAHADGGKLYDPKSGKTYHGTMMAEGDQLHLRGYVGFKAFGKTETWTRASRGSATCSK